MSLKKNIVAVVFVSLICLIYKTQIAEGCSARLFRRGRHIFRAAMEDITSDKTKKYSNRNDDEEKKKLSEYEKSLYTRILPDDEYYQEDESNFKMLPFYTDFTGCYESGLSKHYRGIMDFTESNRKCSKWSRFTSQIRKIMNGLLEKSKTNYTLSKLEKTKEEKTEYNKQMIGITIINATIKMVRSEGHIFHNYCRDPDGVGKPWCFVETTEGLEWEYCPLPVCTPCWRLRQRGFSGQFHIDLDLNSTKPEIWTPECTNTGKFQSTQCWEKYCWCSTSSGLIIKNTLRPKDLRLQNCEELSMTIEKSMQKKKTAKKKFKPENLIRNYYFPVIEPEETQTEPNDSLFVAKDNVIENVYTNTTTMKFRNAVNGHEYVCNRQYYFTRELECRGNVVSKCWMIMRKHMHSWSCKRNMIEIPSHVIEFTKKYCRASNESTFVGRKWTCDTNVDDVDTVREKCKLLYPVEYEIRLEKEKKLMCFLNSDHGKKETCYEL